jgi:hypothetical protein
LVPKSGIFGTLRYLVPKAGIFGTLRCLVPKVDKQTYPLQLHPGVPWALNDPGNFLRGKNNTTEDIPRGRTTTPRISLGIETKNPGVPLEQEQKPQEFS